jgi:hypothetical protein
VSIEPAHNPHIDVSGFVISLFEISARKLHQAGASCHGTHRRDAGWLINGQEVIIFVQYV